VHLRDAKGLRHLARLLADPGQEFHAVDLEAADGPPAPAARPGSRAGGGQPELVARRDLGDAGVPLDATAKAAYQARLTELGRSSRRPSGSTTLPGPPRPTRSGTSWYGSWGGRWGWGAGTGGRLPTPSGHG
jgi:hypothetical protein